MDNLLKVLGIGLDDFSECLDADSLAYLDPTLGEDDPVLIFLKQNLDFIL